MSSEAATRILFVGDLHLGRAPGRLPAGAAPLDLGPSAALDAVVAYALGAGVHAVAFAGDLVEGDNAAFEAYGQLDRQCRRLLEAGIEVCAVAGNHDTRTLPRLGEVLRGFHLLGAGGSWSTHTVRPDGGPPVRLAGWSFPRRHHPDAPPLAAAPDPQPGLMTLGLLHCDLDQPGSRYVPVARTELIQVGYQAWFLGHVHKPDPPPTGGEPFYLGSVTGLDPTETGERGPVLAVADGKGRLTLTRIPLAPLRWDRVELPCPDDPDPDRLSSSLLAGVLEHIRHVGRDPGPLRAWGFRVVLGGRTPSPAQVEAALQRLEPDGLVTEHDGIRVFVDKVTSEVTPAYDLVELARRSDPAGLLARQILALQDSSAQAAGGGDAPALAAELLDAAEAAQRSVHEHHHFRLLDDGQTVVDRQSLRDRLVRAGLLALDGLLRGRGGSHASG